jgi:hypothetical protein
VLEVWVTGVIQLIIGSDESVGQMGNLMYLLKLTRTLRLLRLVRLLKIFQELWLIVMGFLQALSTLLWVGFLLSLIIYSGAIYLTIIVGYNCDTDFAMWSQCHDFFGSIMQSMYTLFQVMTLESWSSAVARKVISVHPYMVVFFVTFLMCTTFGMLNIIVGVIVEKTLAISSRHGRDLAIERDKQTRKDLEALRSIFEQFEGGSGAVDMDEFELITKQPQFTKQLNDLNIRLANPDYMFKFIDADGSGHITVEEFIDGLMSFKSMPTPQEMHVFLMHIRIIERRIGDLLTVVEEFRRKMPMTGFPVPDFNHQSRPSTSVPMSSFDFSQCQCATGFQFADLSSCRASLDSIKLQETASSNEVPLDRVSAHLNQTITSPLITSDMEAVLCDGPSRTGGADHWPPWHVDRGIMTPSSASPRTPRVEPAENPYVSKELATPRLEVPAGANEFRELTARLQALESKTCSRLEALEDLAESLVVSQQEALVTLDALLAELPTWVQAESNGIVRNGIVHNGIWPNGSDAPHWEDWAADREHDHLHYGESIAERKWTPRK